MSKLNPQKASAYVGPGVLRKGGKITPVPNGPLIKKKGPYAGSTLRSGGTIKKAQTGAVMTKRDSTVANIKEQSRLRQNLKDFQKKVGSKPLTPELVREKDSLKGLLKDFSTKQRVKGTGLTEQQLAKNDSIYAEQQRRKKSEEDDSGQLRCIGNDKPGCSGSQRASERRVRREARRRNGGPVKKAKAGAMIKRADGSMSRRGLWDNIRANKGSGKKPTKQMLVQEKKIKAKSKK
jgi:hypothetical protein